MAKIIRYLVLLVLILVVIIGGCFVYYVVTFPPADTGAQEVAGEFITAIEQGEPAQAYALLSREAKAGIDEAAFPSDGDFGKVEAAFRAAGLTARGPLPKYESGGPVDNYDGHRASLLIVSVFEDNEWRVANVLNRAGLSGD